MQGYDASSYGDAFADVYDDWYEGISDVDLTVVELLDLAGSGPVLELGVGTGRIAVPLAEAGLAIGVTVVGIDASEAMLARLAWRDPGGLVTPIHGDMRSDLPDGPFGLVFAAYNTLFNLTDEGAQARCFADVADRLRPGGRFVIEAFVPDDPPPRGDSVTVRSIVGRSRRAVDLGRRPRPSVGGGAVRRAQRDRRCAPAALVDSLRHPRSARRVRACGRARRWSSGGNHSGAHRSTTTPHDTSACIAALTRRG